MQFLKFKQLSKQYGTRQLWSQINLPISKGQCVLLTGDNGAGKTTLLRVIAGLEKPDSFLAQTEQGEFNWRRYRQYLQCQLVYLHQQPYMFEGSVLSNLHYALAGQSSIDQSKRMQQALEWADVQHLTRANAKSLSGGEAQRLALARAWLRQPKLMLLDEPTANMDKASRDRTLTLLQQLRSEGMMLIIASHDPHYFTALQDQHFHLAQGQLRPA